MEYHPDVQISGLMSEEGRRIDGSVIIKSIACMHDRSNGLGGGFAAYGIIQNEKICMLFT